MKKLILLSSFLLSAIYGNAQHEHLSNVADVNKLSDQVSDLFEQNEISEAFDELEKYWPLPQNELEPIEEKTIKYINLLQDRFGKIIGNEKVDEHKISDFAILQVYMVRFELSAIRLTFTYYRNNEGWILNAFKWDDKWAEHFPVD